MYPYRSRWARDAARVFVFFALAAAVFRPVSGSAAGALAIALPPDVVKQGFAYGYVTDYPDADRADTQALKKCRDTTIAGVRPLCTVIQDFKDQCVAVAMDPQAGTPGVGWSVAPDLHAAEAQALSKCEDTAGPGRRAACAVDHSSCDGSAK
jgi:Domain of unknown function (DUF4189)